MSVPTKFYLFRRSNGIYYIGYYDEGRKRWKSTHCTRKAAALKSVSRLDELFKKKPVVKSLTIFAQEFLTYAMATYAAGTVDLYSRSLKQLHSLTGEIALTSLTAQHGDRYKAERLVGHSSVSVNMELRALKAALNTAVRWRLLERNPFRDLHQLRVPDLPPSYLTGSDFERLLAVIDEGWLRELVIFAVSTGMRQGEMLNLRWQDVDLAQKLIHIHSIGTYVTKQGRRRTIPMSDLVHTMLSAKAKHGTIEFVFIRKGRPIAGNHLQHRFKFYVHKAELPKGLHWHSLRHTHASWLVQDGVSLYEVQRLLGHSSPTVTQVYSHLQPEHMHDTVNRISIPTN